MKNLFAYVSILLFFLLFIGCSSGGGGGSSSDDTSSVVVNETAYLIDSPVSGVEYSCGNIKGFTGNDGAFVFNSSCRLQFKVGNVVVGELPGATVNEDKNVFPADLAQVPRSNTDDELVVKIIQLLQSLDDDSDPSNNINISEDTRVALVHVDEIDLQDPNVGTGQIEIALISIGKALIPKDEAIAHYKSTLENEYNIDTLEFSNVVPNPSLYASGSIDENATAGAVIGNIPIHYLGNEDVKSIVLFGDGADFFNADNNGDITLASGVILDYENISSYKLTAAITDINDVLSGASFIIGIGDVDESVPTLMQFTSSIAEDATAGTILGTVNIVDDGNTAIQNMTLSGDGSEKFLINNEGLLYVAAGASFDYETKTQYILSLIASNNVGDSVAVDVIINITDVAEAPILTSFTGSVDENSVAGTVIGNMIVDSGGTAVSSINLSGTGASNFTVSTDGLITVASGANLDYETTTSYSLNAIATNINGDSASVSVNININDVVEIFDPLNTFKILASDGEEYDRFSGSNDNATNGNAIAMYGDYVLIGSREHNNGQGIVYIYKKQLDGTLLEVSKLTASDAGNSDFFGSSVSMYGDYVVIGASGYDDLSLNTGAIYIFKNNGLGIFNEIGIISNPAHGNSDGFGNSVAISGQYIIVGAAAEDNGVTNNGAAFLFKNDGSDNFNLVKTLRASDEAEYKYFGASVAIDGDNIVIGAHGWDVGTVVQGKVYVYKTTNTIEEILPASNVANRDLFGHSVDIDGNYIVVGSCYDDDNASASGTAYIFKNDGTDKYLEITKLTASDAAIYNQFGFSVSISGDNVLIGAKGNNSFTGAAYLFQNDGLDNFTELNRIAPIDGASSDEFGTGLFIDGNDMVIASPRDDDNGDGSGSAYFYTMQPESRPYLINYSISVEVDEGSTSVKDYFADSVNGTPILYSSSNTDSGLFSIDGNGFLTFDIAPDYEAPNDANVDNNYSIDIIVTDQANQSYTYPVNIEVKDTIFTTEISKLLAIDANTSDEFGYQVDINGDYIVVGAYKENNNTGSVYVYKNDGSGNYIHHNKLIASDAALDDLFGYSVAINGDYIIIGASENNDSGSKSGSAYIFKKDLSGNFVEQTKLLASDSSANKRFGFDVDISATKIVVSSLDIDYIGFSVYIYNLDGSNEIKIDNPDPDNAFGYSIATDADNIVVGAITYDLNTSVIDNGALYVYKTDGTFVSKLQTTDASTNDQLGNDVDIDANYIVAGASSAGAVYIFKNDGLDNYTQEPKISGSSADDFGRSVAIYSNYLLIGSPLFDVDDGYGYSIIEAGKVDLYKRTTSNFEYKLSMYASDLSDYDDYGISVAVDNINIVVGSHLNDDNGTDSGSAYHLRLVD